MYDARVPGFQSTISKKNKDLHRKTRIVVKRLELRYNLSILGRIFILRNELEGSKKSDFKSLFCSSSV